MTRWNQRELFTFVVVALLFLPMFAAASGQAVTLGELIDAAIDSDPWMDRSRAVERALQAEAVAAGELPDPKLSATVANVPADTFQLLARTDDPGRSGFVTGLSAR
ncbi:MAG: hypothetical protein U5O39_00050 [Gammaproteobacteria bacterium]|nr:hypothetical protein [Gammaproteobacteria bacterium]